MTKTRRRWLRFVGLGLGALVLLMGVVAAGGYGVWRAFAADGTARKLGDPWAYFLNGYAHSIAFSPDGRLLAVGGNGHTMKVVETATGRVAYWLDGRLGRLMTDAGRLVAWSPDGRLLATAANPWFPDPDRPGVIILWDGATGKQVRVLAQPAEHVDSLAFDPSGRLLAAAHNDWVRDAADFRKGQIVVWDVATGERAGEITRGGQPITSVSYTPAGALIFASRRRGSTGSAFTDGEIVVRPAGDGAEIVMATGEDPALKAVVASPDGALLVSSYVESGRLTIWNATTGARERELEAASPDARLVGGGAFTPDGRIFIYPTDAPAGARVFARWSRAIAAWDVSSGRRVALLPLRSHVDGALIASIAVSGDGRHLAAGVGNPWEGQAVLWRLREVIAP